MYFHYSGIIFPWKKWGVFHKKKMEFPSFKIICAKFVWYWPIRCGEEYFYKIYQCIFAISLLSAQRPSVEQMESRLPEDTLCQVWLKLAQWFWRRRFLKFVNVFSLFRNNLPLVKGGALHLNKLESSLL